MKSSIRLLILVISSIGLGACNDPAHQRQLERREENLKKTARIFEENEADRPEKLGHTLSMLKRQHEEDVENTARNPDRVRKWIEDDFARWKERQPLYREAIKDELKGDPENIKETVPLIIY